MTDQPRSIHIKPDWRSWFWFWIAGILTIPLFGAGLLLLWTIYRKFAGLSYEIRDRSIRIHRHGEVHEVFLEQILDAGAQQSWIESRTGLGSVTLQTDSGRFVLEGLRDPVRIADTINTAAAGEREWIAANAASPGRQVSKKPDNLDRVDYLTGLWQQGLISNDDFERERSHFE